MKTKDFLSDISYKVYNPGGNITALVEGCNYSSTQKKEINEFIMENNPEVEQVGFLSTKECRLEMAGGEFCLNASRCAVYAYAEGRSCPHPIECFRNAAND